MRRSLVCLLLAVPLTACAPLLPRFAAYATPAPARPFVTQEIRYRLAGAGEVWLVWGIDGWRVMPEASWPVGTRLNLRNTQTPMIRDGEQFVATLDVPEGATIDYVFRITRTAEGRPIEAIWDNDRGPDYHTLAASDGVVGVDGSVTLADARPFIDPLETALGVALLVGATALVGAALAVIAARYRRGAALTLIGLTLAGLALRLWLAWDTNLRLPDTSDRLRGDERGYDFLAVSLLNGSFFPSPARTPVYPLFLAGCYALFGHSVATVLYVQALVGAAAVPLTFLLARRFTGVGGSLPAAALVALHPSLTDQVTVLMTEVLYTTLLLVALLALLWALETSRAGRFGLAGALLAVANLCRPTAALLPVVLPLLLPRAWGLRRRGVAVAAYAGAMALVIAPWTYHNYRTHDALVPLSVSAALPWQGSPEFYHLMEQERPAYEIWANELSADRNGGHDPFTIEGDRYFTSRALASIREEPGIYARYTLQKVVFFWFGHPAVDWPWYQQFIVGGDLVVPCCAERSMSAILATRLVPLAALVGLVVLRLRLRQLAPLLAVCGYFTAVHAITFGEIRYSLPLHPVLAVLIGAALAEGWRRWATKRPVLAVSPR